MPTFLIWRRNKKMSWVWYPVVQWFSNILPLSPVMTRENTLSPPPCFFYQNRSHGMFDILFSLFCVFLHTNVMKWNDIQLTKYLIFLCKEDQTFKCQSSMWWMGLLLRTKFIKTWCNIRNGHSKFFSNI
jgi:hypothetical protein